MPLCVLIDDPAAFSGFVSAVASMLELPASPDVISIVSTILSAAAERYGFDFDTALITARESVAVRALLAPQPATIPRPA